MRLDSYDRLIFDDVDIFDLIYNNDLDLIKDCIAENTDAIQKFNVYSDVKINTAITTFDSKESFDKNNQKKWFMPDEYKNMDIKGYLVHVCPKENYQRLIDEYNEFQARNMIDLLRWMKYFVDICRKHKIVWGVGRGSSVSSYILFLIGVHKIDSVKYKLDYKEFLR